MGKLIRDKIPEIIRKDGKIPVVHKASEEEYRLKLREKLKEELADILEVIDAICDFKNFDKEELENIKIKKRNERGGFRDRIIWDGNK